MCYRWALDILVVLIRVLSLILIGNYVSVTYGCGAHNEAIFSFCTGEVRNTHLFIRVIGKAKIWYTRVTRYTERTRQITALSVRLWTLAILSGYKMFLVYKVYIRTNGDNIARSANQKPKQGEMWTRLDKGVQSSIVLIYNDEIYQLKHTPI